MVNNEFCFQDVFDKFKYRFKKHSIQKEIIYFTANIIKNHICDEDYYSIQVFHYLACTNPIKPTTINGIAKYYEVHFSPLAQADNYERIPYQNKSARIICLRLAGV